MMWSFHDCKAWRTTESGAITTGIPSTSDEGEEIFLRFLKEFLNLRAYYRASTGGIDSGIEDFTN